MVSSSCPPSPVTSFLSASVSISPARKVPPDFTAGPVGRQAVACDRLPHLTSPRAGPHGYDRKVETQSPNYVTQDTQPPRGREMATRPKAGSRRSGKAGKSRDV